MSKKSKLVAISFMLFVFIVLFIEVALPMFEDSFDSQGFIKIIVFILIFLIPFLFSLIVISFSSSFFFMEVFIKEKTVLSGRLMTGLFSLCTALLIIFSPQLNRFLTKSDHSAVIFALYQFFGVVCILIICSTVVLISKMMCFFMIKKGYDRSSIIFYLIIGTFVNSVIYLSLLLNPRNGTASEGGVAYVIFGIILTIIALIANAKTIIKLKKRRKII